MRRTVRSLILMTRKGTPRHSWKRDPKKKRGFKKTGRFSKDRRASKVTPKNWENDFGRDVEAKQAARRERERQRREE